MSRPGKEQAESTDRLKAYLPKGPTFSVENIPKPADQQSITINLFASLYPKADKPVQTDLSTTALHDSASRPGTDCAEGPPETLIDESEFKENNCLANSLERSELSVSDEIDKDKSMDSRKQNREKNALISRATSDLERRMLEAELKATEEIAKIQQTVIEKRLAYELASIQDDPEFQPNFPVRPSFSPQSDLKDYEDWAKHRQKIIQKNLALELDSLNHANNLRPPPLPRENATELTGRTKNKPEIIVNRTMPLPSRRKLFPLGFSASKEKELSTSNPTNFAGSPDVRYIAAPRNSIRLEEPSLSFSRPGQSVANASLGNNYRNSSFWKSIMTKVKRKFKSSKNPGPWE